MTDRVKTRIRLGISSVSPSDQSLRCPHEETLGPYLPIGKFRRVFLRNVAKRNFTAKCDFYFSPQKKNFAHSRKGCSTAKRGPRRNAEKELFSWAELYLWNLQVQLTFQMKIYWVPCGPNSPYSLF